MKYSILFPLANERLEVPIFSHQDVTGQRVVRRLEDHVDLVTFYHWLEAVALNLPT